MSEMLDAVLQYLQQSTTDYAYMITGPWGSGKTYFWKHEVVPAVGRDSFWSANNKPTMIYVSLYGISDLDQIEAAVLCQLHPKLVKTGQAATVLGRAALKYFGVDVDAKIDLVRILAPLAAKRSLIICFDDLERAALPVPQVLGHINQYVEHLGARVVILCNEKEILGPREAGTAKAAAAYRRTKEKVVRVTRQFDTDYEPILGTIIADFWRHGAYSQFLADHRDVVMQLFRSSAPCNLRVLKYVLEVVGIAFRAVQEMLPEDAERRRQILWTLLPITFEVQTARLSLKSARRLLTDGKTALFVEMMDSGRQKVGDKKRAEPIAAFARRYKAEEFLESLVASEALADFVTTGYLNTEQLKKEVELERAKKSPRQAAVHALIESWTELEDSEFQQVFGRALEAVRAGEVSDWGVLRQLIGAVGAAVALGATNVSDKEVRQTFDAGLDQLAQTGRFVRKVPWEAQHEFMLFDGESKLVPWLRKRMLATNAELWAKAQADTARQAFAAVGDKSQQFMVMMARDDPDGFRDRPIRGLITAGEFAAKALEVANAAKRHLALGIAGRYKDNQRAAALVDDLPWLNRLYGLLGRWVREHRGSRLPSALLVRQLQHNVGAARKMLKAAKSEAHQRARATTPSGEASADGTPT